ncbi:uncharacterized protein LOC134187327 isoform X1 [Corticium candelabrum]|uniref:uncharacterized protein LOC134187327 isoform X1 n=1 Tax=Corticium candelabrum TaxID=121492 RepID=UPI002E276BBB|nr:uncharacterized protein LOC134187327 isoform X1 [Corticium candelabrum]
MATLPPPHPDELQKPPEYSPPQQGYPPQGYPPPGYPPQRYPPPGYLPPGYPPQQPYYPPAPGPQERCRRRSRAADAACYHRYTITKFANRNSLYFLWLFLHYGNLEIYETQRTPEF